MPFFREKKLSTFVDKDKFWSWVRERAGDLVCPVCHHQEWDVADEYVANEIGFLDMSSAEYGYIPPRRFFPMVLVLCEHCGHALSFSAVTCGLLPPQTRR